MTITEKIIGNILAAIIGLLVVTILPTFLFFTAPGILFGYSVDSPVCKSYKNNTMTRGEMLIFPFAKYFCQKDAGLLQPYASDLINYLGEVPNE